MMMMMMMMAHTHIWAIDVSHEARQQQRQRQQQRSRSTRSEACAGQRGHQCIAASFGAVLRVVQQPPVCAEVLAAYGAACGAFGDRSGHWFPILVRPHPMSCKRLVDRKQFCTLRAVKGEGCRVRLHAQVPNSIGDVGNRGSPSARFGLEPGSPGCPF